MNINIYKRKYRIRDEIYQDVLEVCNSIEGVRKTRIMYSCRISYLQLEQYLAELLEKDMIRKKDVYNGIITYAITDKGRTALDLFTKLEEIFKDGP